MSISIEESFFLLGSASAVKAISDLSFSPVHRPNTLMFRLRDEEHLFGDGSLGELLVLANDYIRNNVSEDVNQKISSYFENTLNTRETHKLLIYPPGVLIPSLTELVESLPVYHLTRLLESIPPTERPYVLWEPHVQCYRAGAYPMGPGIFFDTLYEGLPGFLLSIFSNLSTRELFQVEKNFSCLYPAGLRAPRRNESPQGLPDQELITDTDMGHFILIAKASLRVSTPDSFPTVKDRFNYLQEVMTPAEKKAWIELVHLSMERARLMDGPLLVRV